MIAVPTFQAYAMSRPNGWPGGVYDGTFGEDGLRLFRDGTEVLHLAVGTAVRANGAALTVAVPGGELTFVVRPPAPADPRGVALGFAAFLAGGKREWKRAERTRSATPWWLGVLALMPVACGLVASVGLGWWTNTASSLAVVVNLLALSRRGWTAGDKARMVGGVAALSAVLAGVGVVFFLMARFARSGY